MLFTILGILSAVLFMIGEIPYIVDTIKGTTKPERVTWGIAFSVNFIGFANQLASGASNSLWIFGAATIATATIFGLSLFKGVGGHSKLDIFSIAVALLGLALWIIFNSPTFSIIATLLVAFVGLLPTFAKAKKSPESETKITWLIASISSFLALVSVGSLDWRLIILPLNGTILQAYMSYLLYFPKTKPEN